MSSILLGILLNVAVSVHNGHVGDIAESSLSRGLDHPIKIVCFPPTEYKMGQPADSPAPWVKDEVALPEHAVRLSAFCMGKFPITVEQYCEFLTKAGYNPAYLSRRTMEADIETRHGSHYVAKTGRQRYPARGVTYTGALAYCEWLTKVTSFVCRLPTEAEWEYVAKGKESRIFPWGSPMIKRELYGNPVGVNPQLATPEGIHDLDGPVLQWCLDAFRPDFYRDTPIDNPICVSNDDGRRVLRGGPGMRYGFWEKYVPVPTWRRFGQDPYESNEAVGFRIVCLEGYAKTNASSAKPKTTTLRGVNALQSTIDNAWAEVNNVK